jgi:hypothetical protein
MASGWRKLLEELWPSRSVPRHLMWRREALLFIVIAMTIAAAAGPEIIAAMEMTTLLELLGASMFLTAFSAGGRLVLATLWSAAIRVLLPAPQWVVFRFGPSLPARAVALVYVSAFAAWCLTFVLIMGLWGRFVFRLIA